jgi:hypothetical protein
VWEDQALSCIERAIVVFITFDLAAANILDTVELDKSPEFYILL